MPDAWHQELTGGMGEGEAVLHNWWTTLGDAKLTELIQRAAQNNLSLQEAAARIDEARARRGVAIGQNYGEVNNNASYGRQKVSENLLQLPIGGDPFNNWSFGFDASWEIDVFGRIRRSVESADAAMEATVENYRDVLVTLFAEVALNYVDVRTLQKRIEVAVDNADAQRKTLELVQERFNNGLVPKLDVTQAQSNLATTEAQIPLLRIGLIQAFNRLSVLLAEHPGGLQEELEELMPIPSPPDTILLDLPANLLRQRPDIRRAERDLAAQHARIGQAEADLYPRFSLNGSFAWESRSTGDWFSPESQAWTAFLPSIRWNIWDGTRIRNTVKAEEAITRQALLRYEQTVLLALEEVEDSIASYAKEQIRLDTLDRGVTASQESVELVQELYLEGLTDFQNVLDTQRTLFAQQDSYLTSKGLVTVYLISLYKSLGGGWKAEEEPATVVEE
jgi:NodT family efflux transporter outer membrane factor (OMF) lipoprotein